MSSPVPPTALPAPRLPTVLCPGGSRRVHVGPYESMWVLVGPWVHMGPYRSVWVCVGTCTHPCCAWAPAALVPYCPGLYLRAHSPYPRCTVLQLSTDVSAGFGQPELWLLLVPCQASSPLCRSVRGHPAPGEPGMLTSLHTLNYRQGFNSMVFRPWLRSNIFSCYYPLFTALQNQLMSLHICLEPLLR